MRQPGDDSHHDDQRHAVSDPLIGNLLAEPHHEHRTGNQHDRRTDGEQCAGTQYESIRLQRTVQIGQIGRSLQQQHDNGQVAGPLVDFAAAALPFFLQFLEVGNYDSEQLDYDRSRDIGHNSERENRGVAECSSGEDIQQPQQSVAIHLTLKVVQSSRIDTRNHHKTTEAIYKKQRERKEDSLAQLFNLEYILDGLD